MALLALRSTPLDAYLPQPAEILLNRQIGGTLLPKIKDTSPRYTDINKKFLDKQKSQKHYYNTHTKEFPTLQLSVQDTRSRKWPPAAVVQYSGHPRSYMVQLGNGQVFRRNRRHLREVELPDPDTATNTSASKHSPEEVEGPSNRQTSNRTANSASRPDSTAEDYVVSRTDECCRLGLPTITKDSNSTDQFNVNDPSTHTFRYGFIKSRSFYCKSFFLFRRNYLQNVT